jgi:hypothetical protein
MRESRLAVSNGGNQPGPGLEAAAVPLTVRHVPAGAWVTAAEHGLWTITDPPDEAHDALIDAWELTWGPVSRWSMQVEDSARILEIDSAHQWAELAIRYPFARRFRPNSYWELPLPGGDHRPDPALQALAGQRAQRATMRWFIEPDWEAVSEDFDAVHLSWWGFLTAEGTIVDLGEGDVTMLRNWCSERTLWLRPTLTPGEPLPAPNLSGRICETLGVDPTTDPARIERDRRWLAQVLTTP